MAAKARDENDRLAQLVEQLTARIATLEARSA